MSDVIIRAVDLSKVYRLYAKPHYRFLDMFGILGSKGGAYTEHRALDHVNLEIRRGEKVAFIGRNGAGKSTLLKLATNVIEPTSGTIEVAEGANALLQIGAGFHPDFTGRDNAYSYLAHLGITGKEADSKVVEITEFAELEEYIDQPIKTYSTGMVARLMFATSTSITPKLLVLDEILGVGDAYFAQKSYERIKNLCDREGTTVLLVSHDIYSASVLCERMIWLDCGRVMIDGASVTVTRAYEDSIRAQEERRLRKRNQNALVQYSGGNKQNATSYFLLEVASKNNLPLACPVYFSRFALVAAGKRIATVDLANPTEDTNNGPHLLAEGACWGDRLSWEGRTSRPMLDYGSPFRKISLAFPLADTLQPLSEEWEVHFDYWSEKPVDLVVRGFQGNRVYELGTITAEAGKWIEHHASAATNLDSSASTGGIAEINTAGIHGNGVISVTDLKVIDHFGHESFIVSHGEEMAILISYEIKPARFSDKAQVLMSFHRDGTQDVCRIVTRDLVFDSLPGRRGVIRARFPRLPLGVGRYAISVMIAKEGYYDRPQTIFFSINPEIYTCLSRIVEFEVINGGIIGNGTGVVIDADWSLMVEWSLQGGSKVSTELPRAGEHGCH